jgi:hypothetical protein
MELLLGSHVREHGSRVGRLAGFELEPASKRLRRIIVSPDGDLGPQTTMRPLAAISLVHDDHEIELRVDAAGDTMPSVPDVVLVNRATRLRKLSHEQGRLVGMDVNPADRTIVSVIGRFHWWSRRFSVPGSSADLSTPGEIAIGAAGGHRAA